MKLNRIFILGGIAVCCAIALGQNKVYAVSSISISSSSSVTMTNNNGVAIGAMNIGVTGTKIKNFRMYLSSTNSNIAMRGSAGNSDTIASTTSSLTRNTLGSNTWGYCASLGSTCGDYSYYHPIRVNTNPAVVASLNDLSSLNYALNTTVGLSFAARINNTLLADTYTNAQLISVVAEDRTTFGITYMQEMTKSVCDSEPTPTTLTTDVPTVQLIDRRDGKKYWVAKLADGNCWMTQNLALDLSTSTPLTPSDTDVRENWTPSANTTNNAKTNNTTSTAVQSWSFGEYVVNRPNGTENICPSYASSLSACSNVAGLTNVSSGYTDDFVATESGSTVTAVNQSAKKYDAHYLLGNYYSYAASTAETGNGVTNTDAGSSICPKGWHLPGASDSSYLTYGYLLSAIYDISSSDPSALGKAPFYIYPTGIIRPESGIVDLGNVAYYTSRDAASSSDSMYFLYMSHSSGSITFSGSGGRYRGFQVRCVANTYENDDFGTLEYMQDMTSEICEAIRTPGGSETTTVPTKQLIDRRDGKKYWVAKLADGRCWMTQNLDLDLSTSVTLTPDNTNISESWTPERSTSTTFRTGITGVTDVQSFDVGNYVINTPNAGMNICGTTGSNTTASCSNVSRLTNIASGYTDDYVATGSGTSLRAVDTTNKKYDAHYRLGNVYTWNAATAGKGGSITFINVQSSICPKGWGLPIGGTSSANDFNGLLDAYGLTSSVANMRTFGQAPFYWYRAGYVNAGSSAGLRNIGYTGEYWSRTAYSNGTNAYYLVLRTTGTYIESQAYATRANGRSIRCMAQ